jgi:small subunit ribosomal protein S4
LREKQKTKRIYGVTERQFRRYYRSAAQKRGLTGVNLLQILERRLDNVVYRLGFAESRSHARLLVTHGHFNVNGRRTDVPSMLVHEGDNIEVREGSLKRPYFDGLPEIAEAKTAPHWLDRDHKTLNGRVVQLPERRDVDATLNEQLIIEYYSR